MSQSAIRIHPEIRLDSAPNNKYSNKRQFFNKSSKKLPSISALSKTRPVRTPPSEEKPSLRSSIQRIFRMTSDKIQTRQTAPYSNPQASTSRGPKDKNHNSNHGDKYTSHRHGSHCHELNMQNISNQRDQMKRSSSSPYPQSSYSGTKRRVIFPTLHESAPKASPLTNKQMNYSNKMNPQAAAQEPLPHAQPRSLTRLPAIVTTLPGAHRSSVSSVKHSSAQDGRLPLCNKRSKQNGNQNEDIIESPNTMTHHKNLRLTQMHYEDTTSVPSIESTDGESSSTSPIASDQLTIPEDKEVFLSTPPPQKPIPLPSLSERSPTSTSDEICSRRKLPLPSILRKKALDPPLPKSVLLPSDKLNLTTQDRVDMQKSLSDSCMESFKSLSLSSDALFQARDPLPSSSQSLVGLPHASQSAEDADPSQLLTRHISHEEIDTAKRIRFDPRVWVHEIQRPAIEATWYTADDMLRFKREAILRIRQWTLKSQEQWGNNTNGGCSSEMIATGTGRIISRNIHRRKPPPCGGEKAFYTSPALSVDAECFEEESALRHRRYLAALEEFKTVLIVDCHDIFLKLLSRDVKKMLPNAVITTSKSVEDALEKMDLAKKTNNGTSHGFDLIIIEHRLSLSSDGGAKNSNQKAPLSGANLIQRVAFDAKSIEKQTAEENRLPLVIGMTAYLDKDGKKLKDSGADFVWSKPPPKMDNFLRDQLLQFVMKKRHRKNTEELEEPCFC